jgi:hypothetical protein
MVSAISKTQLMGFAVRGRREPPNKWLQLTVQLVTPFACAKGATKLPGS